MTINPDNSKKDIKYPAPKKPKSGDKQSQSMQDFFQALANAYQANMPMQNTPYPTQASAPIVAQPEGVIVEAPAPMSQEQALMDMYRQIAGRPMPVSQTHYPFEQMPQKVMMPMPVQMPPIKRFNMQDATAIKPIPMIRAQDYDFEATPNPVGSYFEYIDLVRP